MVNQQQTNSNTQIETLSEALASARKMQQDWLNYGLNFVHIYVEDVDGDWLETWGDDECNTLFDDIKEFLISNDDVAVKIRNNLGERSLFDLAVNLEECLRITQSDDKTLAVKNVLAADVDLEDDELLQVASDFVDQIL